MSSWLNWMRNHCKIDLDVSRIFENLSLHDFVTVSTYIYEQLESKQWPGNYLGNSLLSSVHVLSKP